jgi:hypothetical protein
MATFLACSYFHNHDYIWLGPGPDVVLQELELDHLVKFNAILFYPQKREPFHL